MDIMFNGKTTFKVLENLWTCSYCKYREPYRELTDEEKCVGLGIIHECPPQHCHGATFRQTSSLVHTMIVEETECESTCPEECDHPGKTS